MGWARQGHLGGWKHIKTMYCSVKWWGMILVAGGVAINVQKGEIVR
jgi:hypothetical protein